jgi:hypothetical protein
MEARSRGSDLVALPKRGDYPAGEPDAAAGQSRLSRLQSEWSLSAAYLHLKETEARPPAPAAPVAFVIARSPAAKATDGLAARQTDPPTPIWHVAAVLRNPNHWRSCIDGARHRNRGRGSNPKIGRLPMGLSPGKFCLANVNGLSERHGQWPLFLPARAVSVSF